ncbi:SDR family NAD(P)-dependent oxidoreductase [Actinoplanes sp. NPDC051411]|uniref:SDR family NAD(P)-dependent oxidoreductase n=1 Tax=Actinoplanes sp. NPDC051411 TaxID=3155522 RepID=UPI00343DBF8C
MTLITTPYGPKTTASEILAGVDLSGRRYLVTGGASGIGLATTEALRAAGAEVVVATRNPSGGDRRLDLADLGSVATFVAGWSGPLDGVVANAGIMALPGLQRSPQGWELQLATNFLGHFALIALAGGRDRPLLPRQPGSPGHPRWSRPARGRGGGLGRRSAGRGSPVGPRHRAGLVTLSGH